MLTANETQAAQQFWNWFSQNYLPFEFWHEMTEQQQEELNIKAYDLLDAYCDQLELQPGGNMVKGGPEYRLVVSANGETRYFQKAKELVALAPEIPNWQIYALLPPLPKEISIRFELNVGLLYPNDMWFVMMEAPDEPSFLGVHIALKLFDQFTEDNLDELQQIVMQMVANIIGEESWGMDIQHLQLGPLPPDPMEEGFLPLYDLPEEIAEFRKNHPSPKWKEIKQ